MALKNLNKVQRDSSKYILQNQFFTIALIVLAVTIMSCPRMSSEQIPSNGTVGFNNTKFVIPHTISNGTIVAINLDSQSKDVILSIHTTNHGSLTISLPRALIDAKENGIDSHFIVLADKHGVNFNELTTPDYRQLTIPFPNKTSTIEIVGTQIVPEFGGLVFLILISSVLLIVTITRKTRLKFQV
ncbi:MAG: PEFG-CTERM sorting domain-containing protein [Nitrosotalea sp.]